MAVVATGELDDPVSTRETTCETDRAHRGFRARIDHADLIDRGDRVDDQFGQLGFRFCRGAETHPLRQSSLDRGHHFRMAVPQNQRSPRAHVIEQSIAVDVDEIGALAAINEEGFSADSAESPSRAVYPSRNDAPRALEFFATFLAVHGSDRAMPVADERVESGAGSRC